MINMKGIRSIAYATAFIAVLMISVGVYLTYEEVKTYKPVVKTAGLNSKNMSANANMIVKEVEPTPEYRVVEDKKVEEVTMETIPASVVIPPRVEVYEGMTLQELGEKLNRSLGNDVVAGKGELIAAESLNRGVDPYLVVAIISEETGCTGSNGCSNLARSCNNFGGQKGSPSCNGGSFKKYETVDEGLVGMIDNLAKNYFEKGLTTPETIGPKYCEGNEWAGKISWFIEKIRNA